MKRIALSLALLAGTAAAQFDPCVALQRVTSQGETFWQWNWYGLRITHWSNIELVPVGNGIGLLCVFDGLSPAAGSVPRLDFGPEYRAPYCQSNQGVILRGVWWMDSQPSGGRLVQCYLTITDLVREPVGFRSMYSLMDRSVGCNTGRQDLVVTNGYQWQWTRWPSAWAVLVAPERGWW